jgi:pyrimidine operon attenuation protein/uracil phosphoribosyltransferase
MSSDRTVVLEHNSIVQKIRRIAYQLYETNHLEDELVVVAVEKKGVKLAERILPVLKEISELKITMVRLTIDKENPSKPIKLSESPDLLKNKSVVLVDDVLNSGRTLMYAAKHLLEVPLKRMSTVVLVDRRHRRFPIKADFVGLTLSTTLKDHITVEFSAKKDTVYLE